MWVEERTYRVHPGDVHAYLALYEAVGMPVQLQYLPHMLGYYSSELGDLNEIVHLWGHASLDEREANRQRMRADPAFKAYWAQVRPLIQQQRTRILRPAPFFVPRLQAMLRATAEALPPGTQASTGK